MSETVGTPLGSLVLEGRVSASATGELYLARQPALDRRVWVRALPSGLRAIPGVAERFLRDARLGARVCHPSVLAVHDCFAQADTYYSVHEHVEGSELSSLCIAPPRVPVRAALAITLELARGLAALHERRIVHRALTPDRVLVSRWGEVKISGLGDAADLDAPAPATRVPPGPYCAPEVAAGGAAEPGADVYSLGAILHDLLGGEPPAAPRAPLPGVDPKLAGLVASCLAQLAEGRPSLQEVIRTLESRSRARSSEECRAEIAAWLFERVRSARSEPLRVLTSSEDREAWVASEGQERSSGRLGRLQDRMLELAERSRRLPRRALAGGAALAAGAIAGLALFWLGSVVDLRRETPDVSARLAPAPASPKGRVRFVAFPWAAISIDAGPEFLTPLEAPVELTPGRHVVRFNHPRYGRAVRTIEVQAGAESVVRHVFETARP